MNKTMSDEELTAEWRSLAQQERERAEREKARGDALAYLVEQSGRCTNCGRLFTTRACGFSHVTVQNLLVRRP